MTPYAAMPQASCSGILVIVALILPRETHSQTRKPSRRPELLEHETKVIVGLEQSDKLT